MKNGTQTHAMTPEHTLDERAREDAVRALRFHVYAQVSAGTRAYFTNVVAPEFAKSANRPLADRDEVRAAMEEKPYVKFHLAFQRSLQEVMWNTTVEAVERQLPELISKAKTADKKIGSLTLDEKLDAPRYVTAVDIHCMPGGYCTETAADDVAAGAIYDRGISMYQPGGEGMIGRSVLAYVQQNFPALNPKKILDMGCTVGHSIQPYCDAYPDAEIHAIDVAAPCLRYAHGRAESLGKAIHFSQQNAEHTNFADGTFDLVVSHILAHETSTSAWANIIKESHRILKPGGVMVHADLPQFADIDAYSQFLFGNETKYNNEPFWSTFRTLDLPAMMLEAGFAPTNFKVDLADNVFQDGFKNTRLAPPKPGEALKAPPRGFGWGVQVAVK